eukprot:Amastigsp_a407_17.p3 type:complete len:131 gc:universal Amastigsp_a407_17:428-820(+)
MPDGALCELDVGTNAPRLDERRRDEGLPVGYAGGGKVFCLIQAHLAKESHANRNVEALKARDLGASVHAKELVASEIGEHLAGLCAACLEHGDGDSQLLQLLDGHLHALDLCAEVAELGLELFVKEPAKL